MTIFFTADTHFGHKNIIKLCNRPFNDVDEMNREMISRWNSKVTKNDIIYHLGDFSFGGWNFASSIFQQLHGSTMVLQGNHDDWYRNATNINVHTIPNLSEINIPELKIDGHEHKIVLCHYPMRSWNKSFHGSWHLFGHVHGTLEPYGLSFDCGVDTNNFYPYSLNDVKDKMIILQSEIDNNKKDYHVPIV